MNIRIFGLTVAGVLLGLTVAARGDKPATREVKLPAAVDDVRIAGRGDYLLLQMNKLLKVGVFDIASEKIVGYVPLGGNDTLVAGTADSVLLLLRDKRIVQRWSLKPLQKGLTLTLPFNEEVDGLAAGYASNAPALVMTREGPRFLNVTTLKAIATQGGNVGGMGWHPHPQYPIQVAASADGSTFAGYVPGLSPSGIRTLRLEGNRIVEKYEHNSVGMQIPSADGSLLFTAAGVYNSDLKPLDRENANRNVTFPTLHPAYYISASAGEDRGGGRNGQVAPEARLTLHSTGDRTPLLTFEDSGIKQVNPYDRGVGQLSIDKRVIVHPARKRMLVINESRDAMSIRDFDVREALDAKGIDYLFVESLPITTASLGRAYEYPIQVLSKAGGVKFTLDSGPDGMTITSDGVLRWQVPRATDEQKNSVIISIEDASGQSVFHSFVIDVPELAPPPLAKPAPGKTPPSTTRPRPTTQPSRSGVRKV